MRIQTEKPRANKNRAIANDTIQKENVQASGIIDKRSTFNTQQRLQELTYNKKGKNAIQLAPNIIQRLITGTDIKGDFTTIPSGTLTPDWDSSQNVLVKRFNMNATFDVPKTSTGVGEYRQYIKGYFERNGTRDTHTLIGTETLDENTWKEDGDSEGGYGYHASQTIGNKYAETVTGKEMYKGIDNPESNPAPSSGNSTTMHLNFKGQLVDVNATSGTISKVVKEQTWDVIGTHTHS